MEKSCGSVFSSDPEIDEQTKYISKGKHICKLEKLLCKRRQGHAIHKNRLYLDRSKSLQINCSYIYRINKCIYSSIYICMLNCIL